MEKIFVVILHHCLQIRQYVLYDLLYKKTGYDFYQITDVFRLNTNIIYRTLSIYTGSAAVYND